MKPHTRVDRGLGDVADGGALDHVPHGEALDGLVFRDTSGAVGAANGVDMTAVLLVAASRSSFLGLWCIPESITCDTLTASAHTIVKEWGEGALVGTEMR